MKEANIRKLLNESSTLNDVREMTGARKAALVNRVVGINFGTGVPESELLLAVVRQAIRDLGELFDWREKEKVETGCPNKLAPDPEWILMSRKLDDVMDIININPDYIYDLLAYVGLIKMKPGPDGVFMYGELEDSWDDI